MKTIIFLSITFYSNIANAHKWESFDIATFKAPRACNKTTNSDVVYYTILDKVKGAYCSIHVYASLPTSVNASEEFDKEWYRLAAVPFSITGVPQTDTARDGDGRAVVIGVGNFTKESIHILAMLSVYAGFGRTMSVLTLTNTTLFLKNMTTFLSTLAIDKTDANLAATVKAPAQKNTSLTNGVFYTSNKLEGVWMAIHIKRMLYDKEDAADIKWISFFNNGREDKLIPDEVWSNYDKNDKSLGYYKISNGQASLQWFKDVPPLKIIFKTPDKIQFDDAYETNTYYRCMPVDGLKLEGNWTSYANINDPNLDDTSRNNRTIISFAKDGQFVDYGFFATDYHQLIPSGSGSYSLSNFTLSLHYNNGNIKLTSFTGFLSCAP